MEIITHNKQYLPHKITEKVDSVNLYRQTQDISFVCQRYQISNKSRKVKDGG